MFDTLKGMLIIPKKHIDDHHDDTDPSHGYLGEYYAQLTSDITFETASDLMNCFFFF